MKYKIKEIRPEKVICDPIHGYIHIPQNIILNLINAPEFQRLRRIKQLGTSSFVFPSAEHTRFSHSLGVYEISRKICNNFYYNYSQFNNPNCTWNNDEYIITVCAALLHDIGHGPYSHTFEHIFKTNHEKITQEIINSNKTKINKILKNTSSDLPKLVSNVINHKYKNKQVVQIISSQLDADRMDYLLRDAYNTGTKYGLFDIDRILRVMVPYKNEIVFNESGMHSVEDYIISRFQMYQQIYFHPVSRSMEEVLKNLLMRAKYVYKNNGFKKSNIPTLLIPFFNDKFDLKSYLNLDDYVLNGYFTSWKKHSDRILSDLSKRFLNRIPFEAVKFNTKDSEKIKYLQDLVSKAGFNKNYYTSINKNYDLPYELYFPDSKTQIKILLTNGKLKELSSISKLVSSISDKKIGDNLFMFPKEVINNYKHSKISNEFKNCLKKLNSI